MAWLKEHAKQFVDPVLVLHGANDGLVSELDSREFYGDIASTDKTLKIYAHLMHEIFNEPTRHEVIEEAITWIENISNFSRVKERESKYERDYS